MRRFLFPVLLGLGGVAILLSLGVWQLQRLEWKESMLASIAAKLVAPPADLQALGPPDPVAHQYQPVVLTGLTGDDLFVLTGQKSAGAGYEIVTAFNTSDGRRILLDRGFIPESARDDPRPPAALTITGNLLWPDDADSYTPPPDHGRRLWFARDISSMSQFLQTEPILVVARTAEGQDTTIVPVPVDTAGIPNDHFGYALTWFGLAVVWVGMTAGLVWRIRRQED